MGDLTSRITRNAACIEQMNADIVTMGAPCQPFPSHPLFLTHNPLSFPISASICSCRWPLMVLSRFVWWHSSELHFFLRFVLVD